MRRIPVLLVLIAAALLLGAGTVLRSAEYDEQYTLFLTGAVARPQWPTTSITAADVVRLQVPQADLARIAHDLRVTDVHPPLYFWLVAIWRKAFGASLVVARLGSVACALGALLAVGAIARQFGVAASLAMLLTLACYGFVYAGSIARGFALAQVLTLSGVAVALTDKPRGRAALAGALLGAASFANYLAIFIAAAVAGWFALRREGRRLLLASLGMVPFIAADLAFFLVQRQSRDGQFPPFDVASAVPRLGKYLVAAVFGGLPLYADGGARAGVSIGVVTLMGMLLGLIAWRWRRIGAPEPRCLLAAAAAATPIGLLLLALVFDSTPIELRYLVFSLPFLALLLAGALGSLPWHMRVTAGALILAVQAVAIAGWLLRPETMQPARATAIEATALVGDGIVLLPSGNDGVGIVGAFANDAPPELRMLLIARDESSPSIRRRAAPFPRVVLAPLMQDDSSRAAAQTMGKVFADPCWREAGRRSATVALERICAAY